MSPACWDHGSTCSYNPSPGEPATSQAWSLFWAVAPSLQHGCHLLPAWGSAAGSGRPGAAGWGAGPPRSCPPRGGPCPQPVPAASGLAESRLRRPGSGGSLGCPPARARSPLVARVRGGCAACGPRPAHRPNPATRPRWSARRAGRDWSSPSSRRGLFPRSTLREIIIHKLQAPTRVD